MRWSFRNLFALVVWTTSVALFALHGAGVLELPEMVLGALVSIDTLIVQFYFRKKGPEEGGGGGAEA